ncbi:MAG: DinB family protein [candidate division Zixibacteria bacterium]|nr:DinB family protein [candidate division Zixibacteria bacterium]
MKSILWFDRTFNFEMPIEMFPMVVERLRGTPIRIGERIREVPQDKLIERVNDCWSIQENVGHLWDLEPLWYGRIEDFIAGRERLRPAELTNKKTHEANHNNTSIEYLLKEFRSSRDKLIRQIETLTPKQKQATARHPRLDQTMRVIDSAFFMAEHDDHHLAEVSRIIKKLNLE